MGFAGKFPGWSQCMSTSAWMLITYYCTKWRADDDQMLAEYVDDVEAVVGKPGIGEVIKQKYNWITGNTSLWWLVQKAGVEKWLNANGVEGQCIFRESNGTWEELYAEVEKGPVVVGTNQLPGIPGGHIILAVDRDTYNDPFGNATTAYKDANGEYVVYEKNWLAPCVTTKVTGKAALRYMFFKRA
jgi:hypothetical protein